MAKKSVIPMFLIFTIIETVLMKDRYVVREYAPIQMDCNKLENVTRVRWEYISTNDIKSEIIYDSQSNKMLKTGFEISCEPHEAFISTCILKLVRARKEDSGKYICYVEEGNYAKFDSKLLNPVLEIELVIRGPVHKRIIVSNGDSVILPCEHNIQNLTRARWSHVSLQGVMNYQIYYMSWNTLSISNYEGQCKPHQLSCNLKILQANKESAGRYICMVGESLEFEEKYGLDQMTHFIEIQLVVGELTCNENMNKDLTLIGENDCYGIEANVLNLKCSFSYFGNINYNLLHLRWIEKYKFNSLENNLNSSLINHEVKDETNKISIQTNLSVASEMQNSTFQCVLDDTLVKPCRLLEFKTQYVKNVSERSPSINSNDLNIIKCSANKSENVQCSYYWVHEIGGAMIENPYAILPVEHMNSPGIYICVAKCRLGNNECIIRAMEFEVIAKSGLRAALLPGITIAVISSATTIAIIFVVRMRMMRYLKDKKTEGDSLTSTNVSDTSEPVLKSGRKFLRRRHVINDTGERKFLKDQKQKGLCKESSEPDITICELPDEKQLIDIVRLERTILLPVLCHPNPKSVLVIGKNMERLVRTLSTYEQVESTTIFEMDERNVILYRECFPDFPSSLNNPKVKVFTGDGCTFLKNNKNAFDVIINHSLTSKEQNDCLSKQYQEVVTTALKEKGITSLVFSGQDVIYSDTIGSKVKHYCSNLFPAVEYFKIAVLSHPTDLTSCLICSLNPEIHSKLKKLMEDILNIPKIPI